ncbi:hypothetical protein JAAARDRAFT_655196 [Jaapia argillacea MUCL 33604]|uniref:Uncharacterized protein n=1 Tax=Jaapia argillacea MUCL 33604 TaxID=933084 RepID=A0A067Q6S0_9AGAM|nr:hypothetical protein JAAARDRAFT_655196 [Jaapia argillacea MUCL 33604]
MTVAASDSNLKKPFFMVIGTQETASDRATDYVVSTDPSESSPWSIISLPENATRVLKVVPITQRIPFNACVASLYQQVVSGESPPPDVGTAVSCLSLEKSLNIAVVLDKIGGGRDVSTTVTAKGLSDLYVAGVNGIGYYSSQIMDRDPVVILPDVSFQQVVASEDNHKISIFALSKFGDLYYIEGTRKSSTGTPKFTASTYPIRKGVGILSTQYNAAVNACEAMYVDSSSQLKHLWRDSQTGTWSEQTIHVPTSGKAISYHAFVSHIQLQGSRGASIRGGREIILSATELAYVMINDVAHRLDRDPVKLTTDSDGQVRVVIQAGSQLASPTISATLVGVSDPDFSFRVESRQRVLRKWGRIQSGSDLKNAKSTAGDPVFPNTTIHDETFATAANLLSRTPDIVSHVDGSASKLTGSNASASFATSLPHSFFASERTTSGHSVTSKLDWTAGAEDAVDALGDFLESVWHGMLSVAKFAINVVGDVVNFFAEIRGKVLRWVLDTVGSVIRCVATFLKDTLGIDPTRFLALFGFLWDYPNILKTQQIIVKTVQDGSALLQDTVQGNTPWLKTHIKELRPLISPFIKDERVPEAKNFVADAKDDLEKSFLGRLLKSILDNPIVKAVLRYASMWMLQVISLLEDQISFPGLGDLENVLDEKFSAILEKLMIDAEDGLFTFVRDIFNGIGEVVAGTRNIGDLFTVIFSDAFWSIFDAAQDVALSLVDLLSDLLGGILKMVTGHIKFPGTSAFWESFTETPFSIVDVGSLILAQIMYLVTMMWQEKLPFDVMTPWYLLLPEKGSIHFPPIQDRGGGGHALTKLMKQKAPDVALQSDSGSVLTHMMIDLCCYELSSIASMIGTAGELAILSPKTRMEGFELHNFDGEGIGAAFHSPSLMRH